jgi:hypothetical protein
MAKPKYRSDEEEAADDPAFKAQRGAPARRSVKPPVRRRSPSSRSKASPPKAPPTKANSSTVDAMLSRTAPATSSKAPPVKSKPTAKPEPKKMDYYEQPAAVRRKMEQERVGKQKASFVGPKVPKDTYPKAVGTTKAVPKSKPKSKSTVSSGTKAHINSLHPDDQEYYKLFPERVPTDTGPSPKILATNVKPLKTKKKQASNASPGAPFQGPPTKDPNMRPRYRAGIEARKAHLDEDGFYTEGNE